MKKRLNTLITTIKKNNNMNHSNLPDKKKETYIYTEADLGEGILEEGINPSYYTNADENIDEKIFQYSVPLTEAENRNYGLEIVNVEDDFNYSYYL